MPTYARDEDLERRRCVYENQHRLTADLAGALRFHRSRCRDIRLGRSAFAGRGPGRQVLLLGLGGVWRCSERRRSAPVGNQHRWWPRLVVSRRTEPEFEWHSVAPISLDLRMFWDVSFPSSEGASIYSVEVPHVAGTGPTCPAW